MSMNLRCNEVVRTMRGVLVVAACMLLTGPVIAQDQMIPTRAEAPADAQGSATTFSPIEVAQALSSAFERVATIATPSVVNITSSKKPRANTPRRGAPQRDPFFDPFREFFGDDFPGFSPPQQGPDNGAAGLGSGVIVDERGYILTNNHVVAGADIIRVRLHDDRTFNATVVGRDPKSDLAVIKIEGRDFAPLKLGNSDDLQIGEWVVALGTPFGLDNSITAGIVSAKGRSIMGGGQFEDFIQTDAAINPGNSGGPLLNLRGEVVGINTAIFSRSGGYMGIGFAIPSNMARMVMQALIEDGKVIRGWLGVGIQNLTEDLAQSFNYSGTEGALVGHIQEGGPAAKSDLQQGDIIVSYQGRNIKNVNQLRNMVAATKPGTNAKIGIVRNGRKREVSVRIGELPSEADTPELPEEEEVGSAIGISVENLTRDLMRQLRTSRTTGVVVTRVAPGSVAATAGLMPQDIILSVNGKEVADADAFKAALQSADLSKGVRLVVESQGMQRFVLLRSNN